MKGEGAEVGAAAPPTEGKLETEGGVGNGNGGGVNMGPNAVGER